MVWMVEADDSSFFTAKICLLEERKQADMVASVRFNLSSLPSFLPCLRFPRARVGGPEGLRSLTNPKVLIVDKFPSFIQTSIPSALDYPVRSLVQSWCVLTPIYYLLLLLVGHDFWF